MVEIHPVIVSGDFRVCKKPYLDAETLFIFPDNVLDHNSACSDDEDYGPLRRYNPSSALFPRTAGIPVSWAEFSGQPPDYFEDLDPEEIKHIRKATCAIRKLIATHKYKRISFFATSVPQHDPPYLIASKSPLEINRYVTNKIVRLAEPVANT